jgi:hypothetical protein
LSQKTKDTKKLNAREKKLNQQQARTHTKKTKKTGPLKSTGQLRGSEKKKKGNKHTNTHRLSEKKIG